MLDTGSLENDMFYSQLLISLMLFMFAISRSYYLKKSSRLNPISEELMVQLTKCMDARLECSSYRAPRMGVSEMP